MLVPKLILYALCIFLMIFGSAAVFVSRKEELKDKDDPRGLGELVLVVSCWGLAAFAGYLAGLL